MAPRARFDKDYYAALGLGATASEDDVRKAYRRLALQWHPDRNAGDAGAAERFKEISEAYAVLVDADKRREYDRARQVGIPSSFRHRREDIFRDLFADPRASNVFDDLVREFDRMGVRVDPHVFRQTLFGGRAVVTGAVFVGGPFASTVGLLRLARAVMRGAQAPIERNQTTAERSGRRVEAERPRGFLGRLAEAGRMLLGTRGPALASAEIFAPESP